MSNFPFVVSGEPDHLFTLLIYMSWASIFGKIILGYTAGGGQVVRQTYSSTRPFFPSLWYFPSIPTHNIIDNVSHSDFNERSDILYTPLDTAPILTVNITTVAMQWLNFPPNFISKHSLFCSCLAVWIFTPVYTIGGQVSSLTVDCLHSR